MADTASTAGGFWAATERAIAAAAGAAPLDDNVDPERYPSGMPALDPEQSARRIAHLDAHGAQIDWLADRLDPGERRLLADRLAFHALGHRHARVGPRRDDVEALLAGARRDLVRERDVTSLRFAGTGRSHLFDLKAIGLPITLESYTLGIQGTFQLEQYRAPGHPAAWPRRGDVAIDAGGCFGETALWLAQLVGETGHVLTLEFGAENLAILRANLARNRELARRVELVEAALWRESDVRLRVAMAGPASSIADARPSATDESESPTATTVSLDDLVDRRGLRRVDFVKMDIEGAEPAALDGAWETLRRWRPRLAIAVYHEIDHVWGLPRAIDALGLGYRFALGHFTMHDEETVLYAWSDAPPA